MPLIKKTDKKSQSSNISELMHSGYPEKQAVAISYSVQREAKKKALQHVRKHALSKP